MTPTKETDLVRFVRLTAEAEGFTDIHFTSFVDTCRRNRPVLHAVCPGGHRVSLRASDFRRGHRCYLCHRERVKAETRERVRRDVEEHGYDIVYFDEAERTCNKNTIKVTQTVTVRCSKGHTSTLYSCEVPYRLDCAHCRGWHGYRTDKEAHLYLATRTVDGKPQYKYGITNHLKKRTRELRPLGWTVVEHVKGDGQWVYNMERAIGFSMQRSGLHGTASDGTSGSTEAWWCHDLPDIDTLDDLMVWADRLSPATARKSEGRCPVPQLPRLQ